MWILGFILSLTTPTSFSAQGNCQNLLYLNRPLVDSSGNLKIPYGSAAFQFWRNRNPSWIPDQAFLYEYASKKEVVRYVAEQSYRQWLATRIKSPNARVEPLVQYLEWQASRDYWKFSRLKYLVVQNQSDLMTNGVMHLMHVDGDMTHFSAARILQNMNPDLVVLDGGYVSVFFRRQKDAPILSEINVDLSSRRRGFVVGDDMLTDQQFSDLLLKSIKLGLRNNIDQQTKFTSFETRPFM